MKNEYYYVYCQDLLGVKTNIPDFKWVYGSGAPAVSQAEYEKCTVKFNIYVQAEKELDECEGCDRRFQAYLWNRESKTLFYRRMLLSKIKIGYNIRFDGNIVEVNVGKRYLKFIKYRMMNLHGVYYLLSDLANIMLLHNGFLTLYASAIHSPVKDRGVVCFAPPNTGKTITATKLCELPDYQMVGEDIVITDGKHLFSCPWTSSYRKGSSAVDSSGAFGRVNQVDQNGFCEKCDLTDLMVLSLGDKEISADKDEVLRQISILNGYLFHYYSSPIVKVLGYFDSEYYKDWQELGHTYLKQMVDEYCCHHIQSKQPLDFWELIHSEVLGEQ